jgi:hypothetical protein
MDKWDHTPVYQKLIQTLQSGYHALGTPAQEELKAFIIRSQNQNGGFNDRSGRPDLYYSLFGTWMSMALGLKEVLDRHRAHIDSFPAGEPEGTIDFLALRMIMTSLSSEKKKWPLLPAFRKIAADRSHINPAYRYFLFMLLLDAQNSHRTFFLLAAKCWLLFYRPSGNVPCSLLAAWIYVRKMTGLSFRDGHTRLLEYYMEGSGFRVFKQIRNCDMLSTAVALYVLKETGYDLRLTAPGALSFIESNYESGAFLSGDGDPTRDLEYTFYGLIALGSLTAG